MRNVKQNWFETLNAALESENLVEAWQLGLNVGYGETVRHYTDNRVIIVYRDDRGMYERPIHYRTI